MSKWVSSIPDYKQQAKEKLKSLIENFYPDESESLEPGSLGAGISAKQDTRDDRLTALISAAAEPLPDFNSSDFGKFFDRFGNRRVVLLGEASHGTSDFYRARAEITKRLIQEHGFNIVAAEADWPDMSAVDRYIRHHSARVGAEPPFQRFPTWMWRNTDFADLVTWMREYNINHVPEKRVGIYGLDMYSMRESMAIVLEYLDNVDPQAAAEARERYACLMPFVREPSSYGIAVLSGGHKKCEKEVIRQCKELLKKRLEYSALDGYSFFDANMNAKLVESAEKYYRTMYYGGGKSWNLRDTHMFDTLEGILEAMGPESKAIVWAHNSHIGDARYTDMGIRRQQVNIGQFVKERFGDQAALIGFGTHTGTVAAASNWGGPMQVKKVVPSREDSYEWLCHNTQKSRFLLDLTKDKSLNKHLSDPRMERFIGVVYKPETELMSHYSHASLPQQFDAYVWFDETKAVTPLAPSMIKSGEPETYPFGL
uniref:Erythromycin esterase n=1 Tax=Acrobeloides nanus TaxID=290746 RepID=A0A914E125_9BILA